MDLVASIQDQALFLILFGAGILLLILLYREHQLTKQIKELKRGYYPRSRMSRLLEAMHLRKPPKKPPHGDFKKGDINIRIYGRSGHR